MRSLHIGATGMLAQQTNVEIISNNIANMNTTAYSRRRAEFHDLLYQNMRRVGASSSDSGTIVPAGVQLGLGVKTASVYRISEHGTVLSTDNTLDLAIQGNGYFQGDITVKDTELVPCPKCGGTGKVKGIVTVDWVPDGEVKPCLKGNSNDI